MGFKQCNLSTTSSTPPLVGDSQRSFSFFYKMKLIWTNHFIAFHVSNLLFLFHFIALLRASLFLSMLHCITLLCVSLLLVFWCSSYFVVVHHASLLFHASLLLLKYCSLCFVVALHASLLLLFNCCSMFCYSCCFVVVWCFVAPTILPLHGVSPLLCASLFNCPPRYLYTPCCFVALLCFIVVQSSLFPCLDWYPPPLFFYIMWRFEIVWEEGWKHLSC